MVRGARRFRGRRTYLVGVLMMMTAVALLVTGHLDAVGATQWVFEALGVMGLRAGVHAVVQGTETGPARDP